ncbi:MAG: LTA synthase family protein [Candidatus Accumulibacter sp. UW27]
MAEPLALWSVVAAALGGAAVSLAIEGLLRPASLPFWRRPLAAFALHLGLWLLLFVCLLLVLRRPFFAAGALLAGLLFLVLVSNAKYHSLREPFIFQDFEYFSDALKHPRLYLPFLGAGRAVLALLSLAGAIAAGLLIEQPLLARVPVADFLTLAGGLTLLGLLLLGLGARKRLRVTFDAAADLRQLGLLAALWRYGEEELIDLPLTSPYAPIAVAPPSVGAMAHLVVVQSESFFDVRRLYPGIRSEVLREFDDLQASAHWHGQLAVSAWGANTVRTEFAFLSGLAAESLAVHRFNPYRRLARQGMATLAGFLSSCGYRTVCVHPYAASFYSRDKVFPQLGFDEFIDLRDFAGAAKSGPYISDLALAERVCSLLGEVHERPLFVFVITMENHGPLHLEKVHAGDAERFYSTPPPAGCDDLTVYLRHLVNADRMAGRLRAALEALPGAGTLCWFGDHVPILPEVYRRLGSPAGPTDYFIWRKGGAAAAGVRRDLGVEQLGGLLLQEMGLFSTDEPAVTLYRRASSSASS